MEAVNKSFQFENGLTLLFEEMNWSNSFAIEVCVPAGSNCDPADKRGIAALACEMTNRGAGGYNNRQFLEKFEYLGVDTSEYASPRSSVFHATGLIDNWEQALELLTLQIREPALSEEEFDECRQIQLQEVIAIEDEPRLKSGRALNSILFPEPWGSPVIGTVDSIKRLTIEDVRCFHQKNYHSNGAIVAIAGRINWERALEKVGELFGDWVASESNQHETQESNLSTLHLESDVSQTHIRLGYSDVPFGHPDYWRASSGIDVLSGGMSSRLFTEVREKRGLCYTVNASHFTLGPYGGVTCYCGTTAEKAQQSLEVIVNEFDKLKETPISNGELGRMKIRAKSDVVMQRESTLKRVAGMIRDWLYLNKVRSLEETLDIYDKITKEKIESYFSERPNFKFRLVTVGPNPLELPIDRLY